MNVHAAPENLCNPEPCRDVLREHARSVPKMTGALLSLQGGSNGTTGTSPKPHAESHVISMCYALCRFRRRREADTAPAPLKTGAFRRRCNVSAACEYRETPIRHNGTPAIRADSGGVGGTA